MSVGLVLMAAVASWIGSLLLPSKGLTLAPDTMENWINFAGRCLRDILQVIGVVFTAVGVVAICSQWALKLETSVRCGPRRSRPGTLRRAGMFMLNAVPRLGLWLESLVLRSSRRKFLLVTCGLSIVSSALFAYFVMDRITHVPDETAMLFQAQVLASGRLYAEAPPVPEAFDFEFVIADPPKWYGKYFIGQSLFLVPGVWLGVPWLMHPLLIGACVWLTYLLGQELLNDKLARIAAVLMMVSPLRLYTGGTMMGHASSLFMLLVFALAVAKLVRHPDRWKWGLLGGFFLGMAVNARPLTAVGLGGGIALAAMFALPWRRLKLATVLAFSLMLALWAGIFLGYNLALTGDAMLTPFNKWSPNDRLGFGEEVGLEYWSPENKGHSLRRGLLVDAYYNFDALGPTLIGWGHSTLLLLLLPLVLTRFRGVGWALFAAWLSLAFIHIFHVSSGVLMGQPRYWSEAMPQMILLIAISLAAVRQMVPHMCRSLGLDRPVRTGRSAIWLAGAAMVLSSLYVPSRLERDDAEIQPVRRGLAQLIDVCDGWTFNHKGPRPSELAKAHQIDNALVFVNTGTFRTQHNDGVIDEYPYAFILNTPDLDTPVVYARDLGPEKNAQVAKHFAGRTIYWLVRSRENAGEVQLVPVESVQTLPAP